ncbi:MAG: hypothetical protein ICV55_16120 [Coleofasciculus sp. C3-bin4]|nr:hypothetical protein [Coleofasciculus sp. C3-bin4]
MNEQKDRYRGFSCEGAIATQPQMTTIWTKTMHDYIFATFLYVAMFCFICCLRYQPNHTGTIANNEPQPADMNQVFTTESEQKAEPTNAVTENALAIADYWDEFTKVIEPEAVKVVEPEPLKIANTLNLEKLTLRQCRAVIREINKGLPKQDRIRQKINGKDAPVDWLRSQITRYLETHPVEAMAMEELLQAG